MIIDTDMIERVLSERSGYSIAKAIGVKPQIINRYQNGTASVENMTLKLAGLITKMMEEEAELKR